METEKYFQENKDIEIPIGERYIDDIECEKCHGTKDDCEKCFGWGGIFINPENNKPVNEEKQKEIVLRWKNLGVERYGNESMSIHGRCACGYEKSFLTKNNPKDFTKAEKEIYRGHDYETDCPHEPGINVV